MIQTAFHTVIDELLRSIFSCCSDSVSRCKSTFDRKIKELVIAVQIEKAKQRVKAKAGQNAKYIAYFQDFTNTYAPLPRLRELFYEAINHPRVAVLSVATRPDCLPREVLELLEVQGVEC